MSASVEQETTLPPNVQKYLDSSPSAVYVGCFDSEEFHLAASKVERPYIGVQFREGVPPNHKWHLVKQPHVWVKKYKTAPDEVAVASYQKSAP